MIEVGKNRVINSEMSCKIPLSPLCDYNNHTNNENSNSSECSSQQQQQVNDTNENDNSVSSIVNSSASSLNKNGEQEYNEGDNDGEYNRAGNVEEVNVEDNNDNVDYQYNENKCKKRKLIDDTNENYNNSNDLSVLIRKFFTHQHELQNITKRLNENDCNKKPKKSFLISDILGIEGNNDVSTSISNMNNCASAVAAAAAAATLAAATSALHKHQQQQQHHQNFIHQSVNLQAVNNQNLYKNQLLNYSNLLNASNNLINSNNKRLNVDTMDNENNKNKKFKQDKNCHKQPTIKIPKQEVQTSPSTPAPETSTPTSSTPKKNEKLPPNLWPAWVYCTRYSDRPSAGPRQKRGSKKKANINKTQTTAKIKAIANSDNKTAKLTTTTIITAAANKLNTFSSSTSTSSLSSHSSCSNYTNQDASKCMKTTFVDDHETNSVSIDGDTDNNHNLNIDYETGGEGEIDVHANGNSVYGDDDNDDNDDDDDDDDDNDSTKSGSKRPRTAFTSSQLNRLKDEFDRCKYLTGEKRQYLANELNLNESQIKIWFQNKRAKIKKSSGVKNTLALQLMAQGLYNHGSKNLNFN